MANLGFAQQQLRFVACYLSFAILLLPAGLNVQAKSPTTKIPAKKTITLNPVNPFGAGPIANYTKPVRNVISPVQAASEKEVQPSEKEVKESSTPCPSPTPRSSPTPSCDWTFTLSQSYEFLNDRSRVGGVSSNSNSAIVDLTATDNNWPWTCIDISYMYSHESGSSPSGINETGHQNVGSLRVLQPIPLSGHWVPATLSTEPLNFQLGVILSANYGEDVTSIEIPQFPSIHSSTRTFLGDALLDFQIAWFHNRKPCECDRSTYPSLLVELSSGIQFSTSRLHAAENSFATTSFGDQLTYQNICCVTYSFSCGFGLLAAAEWDAPIHSTPLAGSQPFYANTAVFTGGLVYNIYAYRKPDGPQMRHSKSWASLAHWSASLLYSYTAFNPLFETNQLQVQLSYTF